MESLEEVVESKVNTKRKSNALQTYWTRKWTIEKKTSKRTNLTKLSSIRSIHFERYETFHWSRKAWTEKDGGVIHTAELVKTD
jgi:hypothetical protein